MTHFYNGDYVRPTARAATGLSLNSVWRAYWMLGGIRLEAVPAFSTDGANIGKCFNPDYFEKVKRVGASWIRDDGSDQAIMPLPIQFGPVTCSTVPVSDSSLDPKLVDAVWAALNVDNSVKAAQQKLAEAKEQARKQRKLAAQKAKEQAQAAREAKAKEEALAKRYALLQSLHHDERLADATKALILEVEKCVNYIPERIAPDEVYQHADQLDALAKSYGYKIVRAGSKCIVAKA